MNMTNIDMKRTGERICRLREDCGLTVVEMQKYLGFSSVRVIYKWEKGRSLPSLETLVRLGDLFHLPVEEILVLNKEKTTNDSAQGAPALPTEWAANVRAIAEQLGQLQEQAYAYYEEAVEEVLLGHITEERELEAIMDGLAGFRDEERFAKLYRRLCNHISKRFPDLVNDHVVNVWMDRAHENVE